MHLFAEEGIAAHWRYKQSFIKGEKTENEQENTRLDWIKNLLKTKTENSEEFLELLKLNLQPDYLIVVTPEEDYIKLPKDSTPLDFAFAIHTEVGFRCIGAKINGKHTSLRAILKDGDIVEVLTSTEANPSKDWLKILKSSRAKQKLTQWIRNKEREDAIKLGHEIFEKRCRKLHWKIKTEEEITELSRLVKVNDKISLYYLLGTGKLLFSQIKQAYIEKDKPVNVTKEENPDLSKHSTFLIKLGEINNLMINFALCCHPIPGDEVIGYITRGRGISVHQANCHNPSFITQCNAEPERVVQLQWSKKDEEENLPSLVVNISVTAKNRARITFDILGIFARYRIKATETNRKTQDNIIILNYRLAVHQLHEIDLLLSRLKRIPGIEKVIKDNLLMGLK